MKKIITIIVTVLIVVLCSIIIMSALGNNKPKSDIKSANNIMYLNYGASTISETNVYYGEDLYYISNYNKDNKKYIGVLDKDYNLTMNVEEALLKEIDELKGEKYIIGYKYDKLVYEVKKERKDGFTYSYYDALNGEFIKKINVDR